MIITVACTAPSPGTEGGEVSATDTLRSAIDAEDANPAMVIIDRAIVAAGLENMDEAAFTFQFRDKRYRYQRTNGTYTYERWWTDTTTNQVTRDVLDNDGFLRFIDGQVTELTEKNLKAYRNSVNSVIYFAFLPWVLRDPAVIPTYLGRDTIKGEVLDQIGIAFTTENGGEDAEDDFMYWFTPDTYQLKYLAYTEAGNKFPRLREANNEREVDGITIRDYRNYNTPEEEPTPVGELADAFNADALNLLSEINLEEVRKVKIRADRREGNAVLD